MTKFSWKKGFDHEGNIKLVVYVNGQKTMFYIVCVRGLWFVHGGMISLRAWPAYLSQELSTAKYDMIQEYMKCLS